MDENQRIERMEEKEQSGEMVRISPKPLDAAQDSSSRNNINGDESPVCPVCQKVFPAWRSLYGHMKCHPERQWRGFVAPYKKEESAESDTEPIGIRSGRKGGRVMKWGVTGKRGRRGTFEVAGLEAWEAARSLVSLSVGNTVSSGESEIKSNGDSNGPKTGDPDSNNGSRVEPNGVSGQTVYRCKTCKKVFTSYQALGGHRSKHYRERTRVAENGSARELSDSQSSQVGAGHPRIHWVGPRPDSQQHPANNVDVRIKIHSH